MEQQQVFAFSPTSARLTADITAADTTIPLTDDDDLGILLALGAPGDNRAAVEVVLGPPHQAIRGYGHTDARAWPAGTPVWRVRIWERPAWTVPVIPSEERDA